MEEYSFCTIKSFKHDGSLHRTWLENWRVPPLSQLDSAHVREKMIVTINDETRPESSGKQWIRRCPGSLFSSREKRGIR